MGRKSVMAAFESRYRRGGRWWAIGVTAAIAVAFAVFFVGSSGAVITGSPSGFEANDGNMTIGGNPTPVPGNGSSDWNCFYGLTSHNFASGSAPTCSGVTTTDTPLNPLQKSDLAATTTDDSWVNGQKMDTPC